jgi:hypothetical protein
VSLTAWEETSAVTQHQKPYVRVSLPPLDELAEKWPEVAPLLAKATVRTGCYEPIDLLIMAMTGRAAIWLCQVEGEVVAAFVTEVKQYPRRRILEMLFCGGGGMRDWIGDAVQAMDRHAKETGCALIACTGRKGWARAWGGEVTDVVVVRGL